MEYIKGVFLKEKTGKYGKYFVLSMNREGLDSIKNIGTNNDGFYVMIASPRKDNPDKFSIKPFVPKNEPPF